MRLISLLIFVLGCAVLADSAVHLKFSDLNQYLETSPTGRLLLSERDAKVAAAKSELQWRNPELEAEHEALSNDLTSDTESTVLIGKTFQSPWSRASYKKAGELDMDAAEFDRQFQQRELLADFKYAYVELQLKHKMQRKLELFLGHILRVSQISADRREQGTLSGMENQLLQMSVFNIKAAMLHLNSDIRRLDNAFKTRLGLAGEVNLVLETAVNFSAADLSLIDIEETLATSPHLRSYVSRMTSAQKKVAAEKADVLPDLTVMGGYKQVNQNLKGSVIGLSIPLPVLSLNRASIQRAQAELASTSIEYDLTKSEMMNHLQESVQLVQESQLLLADYATQFETTDVMDNLVFSFKEGWLSLTELFSSIEVYASAIESYYAHVLHYYENIFQLEALTGQELVQF